MIFSSRFAAEAVVRGRNYLGTTNVNILETAVNGFWYLLHFSLALLLNLLTD